MREHPHECDKRHLSRAVCILSRGNHGIFAGSRAANTGVAGSPDATTTIDGALSSSPAAEISKEINRTPGWPARVVPPKGAPNILLVMTDDVGFGAPSTFGGVIPTPSLDRVAANGLRYTNFHSTSLCSPTRAALVTGRNHHSVGFGVISEIARLSRLQQRDRKGQCHDRPNSPGNGKYSSLNPGMGSTIRCCQACAAHLGVDARSGFRGRWIRRIAGSR
jgi:sulfatase-like protein